MNSKIKNIEKLLVDLQTSLQELQKDVPNIKWSISSLDILNGDIYEFSNEIDARFNESRLRKIALDKLTPEDKEILGLK